MLKSFKPVMLSVLATSILLCCVEKSPAIPSIATQTGTNNAIVPTPDSIPLSLSGAGVIACNFFKNRELRITGDSLDPIEALKALFPGKFYPEYEFDEDAQLVAWVCDSCPKKLLAMEMYEDVEYLDTFPSNWANFTQWIGSLPFTQNGIKQQVLFFSTGFDYPGTGRFTGGILSAAVFAQTSNAWVLQSFTPLVTVEGSYNKAHPPRQVLALNPQQSVFILEGGLSNGAGSEYVYTSAFVFAMHEGEVVQALVDHLANCWIYQHPMRWETVFESGNNGSQPDLYLVTNGHFEPIVEDPEVEKFRTEKIDWWRAMRALQARSEKKEIQILRQYSWRSGQYILINTLIR
jgi:hypothetical protein